MAEAAKSERTKAPRTMGMKAERALKDANKAVAKGPELSAEQKSVMQVEQAKVLALLELADSIRAGKQG